jgi:hypothetical protein
MNLFLVSGNTDPPRPLGPQNPLNSYDVFAEMTGSNFRAGKLMPPNVREVQRKRKALRQ